MGTVRVPIYLIPHVNYAYGGMHTLVPTYFGLSLVLCQFSHSLKFNLLAMMYKEIPGRAVCTGHAVQWLLAGQSTGDTG